MNRIPRWLRPPLAGAAILIGIVLVRAAFVVPRLTQSGVEWREFARVLVGAGALGAGAGLAYTVIGHPLRRLPKAGPYLAGIVTFSGFIFPLMAWGHIILGGEPLGDLSDPWFIGVLVVLSVVAGSYMGHRWFKNEDGSNSAA